MRRLFEREREQAAIGGLIGSAADGNGRLLLLDGPAGIGKTTLLAETRALARGAGMRVLTARCDGLEQELGYGVVRQLFEGTMRAARAEERQTLLAGAAGLAAPVVAPAAATEALAGDGRGFAALHGLYWLTANLAGGGPLLLVVDDAQWCDAASLRFLLYLARRLDGLGVLIALGIRSGDPDVEAGLLGKLRSEPATCELEPRALSTAAVSEVVRSRLGGPDERFVRACHRATAGNPFLLEELIRALTRDGIPATGAAAERVGELGPEPVARAVVARLARLSPAAVALARAIAVLGDRTEPRLAAALARLDEAAASDVQDSLVAIELLAPERPLGFVHPIVRTSIYRDLAPAARSRAHRRAAQLLAEERRDPGHVAAHLLASDPGADGETVRRLRAAARSELGRGAPRAAIAYLRRALAEPPAGSDRGAVVHELGCAEAAIGDPAAATDLAEALRLADDPASRAHVARDLIEALVFGARFDAALALAETTLAELGEREPDLRMTIEWMRTTAAVDHPRLAGRVTGDLPRLRALVERGGRASRRLALLLARASAMRTGEAGEVVRLVELGLDQGRLLAEEGSESPGLTQALAALLGVDALDRAGDVIEAMLDDARRRGSLPGLVWGLTYRGLVYVHHGSLRSAEADLLRALSLAREHELSSAIPTTLRGLVDSLLERPEREDVAACVEAIADEPAAIETYCDALLVDLRARRRLAAHDTAGAVADLRRCVEVEDALDVRNPVPFALRSALALALGPDAREEASQLVAAELDRARATGLPRAEGVALRAAGILEVGEPGIELLREAVEALARCPSRLELARGLVELGSALRRAGRRREARDPLRRGLELAHRCGASRLVTHAATELRVAGAKPRRIALSGPDALTPAERRIAEMAAREMSNQQMAEALFVTPKTVENHLGRVYRKLRIHSRADLREVLGPQPAPDRS